jgi:choline dehydrogenase-like flavoprotein
LHDQIETYHGPGDAIDHGFDGPIHVSDGGFRQKKMLDDLINASSATGWPEVRDLQNFEESNGVERWLRTVTLDGRRSTAAHGYIHPLLRDGKHTNLHVLTETHVVHVLFDDNKRAVGVEVTPNPNFVLALPGGTPTKTTLRARKLVVLSAGALGSAPILERSGVGNPDILKRAGVPLVEALPGVGSSYQDHPFTLNVYKTNFAWEETMDRFYTGQQTLEKALAEKDEMLKWSGIDFGSKLRPSYADVERMGPEFMALWDKEFKGEPNRPLVFSGTLAG